jgi:hypothetical protein
LAADRSDEASYEYHRELQPGTDQKRCGHRRRRLSGNPGIAAINIAMMMPRTIELRRISRKSTTADPGE